MAKNTGYLQSSSAPESDECLTPRMAVLPIIKYLKKKRYQKILCPFDEWHSMYVRILKEEGFDVFYSHLKDGCDFFEIDTQDLWPYDCIVSNPPFSLKDKVLKHLYESGVPFAMLLPQNSLQSLARVEMFIDGGLEYLGFDRRIPYYHKAKMEKLDPSNHFASGYFCKDVLPQKLIFNQIDHIQEPYYEYVGIKNA